MSFERYRCDLCDSKLKLDPSLPDGQWIQIDEYTKRRASQWICVNNKCKRYYLHHKTK